MKLLKRLSFVLLLAVLFASCSKDDDNSSANSLLGTWKLTSEKYNGTPAVLNICELKTTLQFTETKVTVTEYDGANCEEIYTETNNYTRNNNTLSMVYEGQTQSIEITKLTSTVLELTDTDGSDTYVETYTRL